MATPKSTKKPTRSPEYRTWRAMKKYAADEPLTERDWDDLSWITLIDRTRLEFGPGNIRWATSETERAENRQFYEMLGRPPNPGIH